MNFLEKLKKHKKIVIAVVAVIAAAGVYTGLCFGKVLPEKLNILSYFGEGTAENVKDKTTITEDNEFTPVTDKMYFQDELIESGTYLINGELYMPVEKICKVFGYEYKTDDKNTTLKTSSGDIVLELYSDKCSSGTDEKTLGFKIKKNEEETYVAYADIETVFAGLKTVTLMSGKKSIIDPVPYMKSGQTFEKIYDATLKEYAVNGQSITIEEFRKMYKIPAEVSLDTDTNLFYSNMSLKDFYGDKYEENKKNMINSGISEELFRDGITYGEFMDSLTAGQVFGTDNFAEQVKTNGLSAELIGFEVTQDTSYKELRNIVALNQLDKKHEDDLKATPALSQTPAPTQVQSATPAPTQTPAPTLVPAQTTQPTTAPQSTIPPEKDPKANTVEAFAKYLDLSVEEFLEKLGLDPSTPPETNMDDLLDKITLEKQAKVFGAGMSVEEYGKAIGIPSDKIRPDMTMKEVAEVLAEEQAKQKK